MSWEYCPPKSRTSTSSVAAAGLGGAPAPASSTAAAFEEVVGASVADTDGGSPAACSHPHALLALQVLALGLQRRGDHQLSAVELGDVAVAAGRHRGLQPAHEVERAVVL